MERFEQPDRLFELAGTHVRVRPLEPLELCTVWCLGTDSGESSRQSHKHGEYDDLEKGCETRHRKEDKEPLCHRRDWERHRKQAGRPAPSVPGTKQIGGRASMLLRRAEDGRFHDRFAGLLEVHG